MRQNEKQVKRFANAGRIRTIDFARSGIDGTGTLSPRSRRTLAVYIVLVKMGYCGISAPMGAIADAIFRSSHGEAGSIRTLQRANRELEDRGFIHSVICRPGRRARGAIISFELDAFAYWTRTKIHNVSPLPTQSHISPGATACHPPDRISPLPTQSHISPGATTCRPPDRTRDQVASNSQDLSKNEHTEQRAGARANKTTSRKRKNAVLYSVDKVLSKMTGVHRADRRAARARAMCEVKALAASIALVNPSGVDWEYWAKRWNEFSVQVRESTVAREILPKLLPGLNRKIVGTEVEEQLGTEVEEQLVGVAGELFGEFGDPQSRPTENQIRAVREMLEHRFSLPDCAKPLDSDLSETSSPNSSMSPATYPVVDETDPDMQILVQARARARARVNSG